MDEVYTLETLHTLHTNDSTIPLSTIEVRDKSVDNDNNITKIDN